MTAFYLVLFPRDVKFAILMSGMLVVFDMIFPAPPPSTKKQGRIFNIVMTCIAILLIVGMSIYNFLEHRYNPMALFSYLSPSNSLVRAGILLVYQATSAKNLAIIAARLGSHYEKSYWVMRIEFINVT